jgi:16S rRNA (uracil1498-N3)-methyltransferase
VEIFDGRGLSYRAKLQRLGKEGVELVALGEPTLQAFPRRRVILATAIPKGERFDWLVEKATELGVSCLIPLLSERSVVDPRGTKLDRLRRLVVEAAKQCGRNRLMELGEPIRFSHILQLPAPPARLLAHPGGLPASQWAPHDEVLIAVGPEGGFTEFEVEQARSSGWLVAGLGESRLRIETAGLAACALLLAL